MSTELDLDITTLVGEIEAPTCESFGHEFQGHVHDRGPATHYGRLRCNECGTDVVKAYCATFVAYVLSSTAEFACFVCRAEQPQDHITILGPVGR